MATLRLVTDSKMDICQCWSKRKEEKNSPDSFQQLSYSAKGGLGREGGIIFCAIHIVKLANDI